MESILIIGGVHGVEPQSAFVAENLAQYLEFQLANKVATENLFKVYQGEIKESFLEGTPFGSEDFVPKSMMIIPDYNRYGLANNTRGNEHEVDLNRNFPAKNWSPNYSDRAYMPGMMPGSEDQTKALIKIIKENHFDLIISIHTNHYVKHANPPQVNYDGPLDSYGHKQAHLLSELIELPLTHDIGYSTPGSLGSYAKDLQIPCITLELDDRLSNDGSWALYGFSLLRFFSK